MTLQMHNKSKSWNQNRQIKGCKMERVNLKNNNINTLSKTSMISYLMCSLLEKFSLKLFFFSVFLSSYSSLFQKFRYINLSISNKSGKISFDLSN